MCTIFVKSATRHILHCNTVFVDQVLNYIMDIEKTIVKLTRSLDDANVSSASCSNATRRSLYSDVELFRLDIENSNISEEKRNEVFSELTKLSARLDLHPKTRRAFWWRSLEDAVRFTGLFSLFLFSGVFLSLPLIGLKIVDTIFININLISPKNKISDKFRRFIGKWFVIVSGVTATIDGLEEDCFKESCVIMTFAHASNLDGFLVSSTCPVPHYALAKKELFLVPFFSWISFAFGGVPVDRNNRDRAVKALHRSTEAAKSGNMCIAIAPEGTRSTTGQLQEFKKGNEWQTTAVRSCW
jgi:1-acyl-sn-glycerol-3-phosphate acyltransferase